MSLKPTDIHLQKTIAMGTTNMSDAGDFGCDRAFGEGKNIHGKEEVSKKRHLPDEKRRVGKSDQF